MKNAEFKQNLLLEKHESNEPYGAMDSSNNEEKIPTKNLEEAFPCKNGHVRLDGSRAYTPTEVITAIGFGRSQTLTLIVLTFAWFAELGEISLMPILSTRLYVEWDLTPELESALGAASFAGFAISYPLWGLVADRIGRRPTLIVSHCWILFWGLLCCLAPNLTWLIIFRSFFSLAGGIANIMMPYYYEFLAPEERYIGVVSGHGFGAAIGNTFPVLLALIMLQTEQLGAWRWYLFANTAPFFIFIPLAILFLEESPRYLMSKGHNKEALSVLRRIAERNKVELPESLALIPDTESGDSDEKLSLKDQMKLAVTDRDILRSFLCIVTIGVVSRYVLYGTAFLKTEVVFKQGQADNYCKSDRERTYFLETDDYLALLLIQIGDLAAAFVMIPVLKHKFPLRECTLAAYSIGFLLMALLFFCPSLIVALILITSLRTMVQVSNSVMMVSLSGLLPTRVRSSLFGFGTFFMYLVLPFTPYLTQNLSKYSQHWVTSVLMTFLVFGTVGALFTPAKIYSN